MLTPNYIYYINGVLVNEKIVPDGTVWKDDAKAKACGFYAGALYKKEQKLCGIGIPAFVTIHNTDDAAHIADDAELYTRATYNENMGSARVHFYVDENGAWQNLKAGTGMTPNDPSGGAEVSWHAGDGSTLDGGNMTSISMEIIMHETTQSDIKAMENGAKIAAWLLYKYNLSIDRLVSHTYWVNKANGTVFSDPDEQSTNLILGKKWCPTYIFRTTVHSEALANWKQFKNKVARYMNEMEQSGDNMEFKLLDKVKIKNGVTSYSNGAKLPSWVISSDLYVRQINSNDTIVISTLKEGAITGTVNKDDLVLVGVPIETKEEVKEDPKVEVPKTEEPKVDAKDSGDYIKDSNDASNFLVKLLNHIITFIVNTFGNKNKGE